MIASRKLSLYLKGVSAGTGAMMVNLLTGFANLWLLTHILDKQEYGALALAQAWILFVGLLSTLGLDRSLLFRIAAMERVEGKLVGGEVAGSIIIIVSISGILFAGATLVGIVFFRTLFSFEPFWFVVLSCTVPFMAVITVLTAWQTANDRAHVAQVLSSGGSVIRMLLLIAAWVVLPNNAGIATAMVGGAILSIFLWFPFLARESFGPLTLPSWRDWSYGLKLLLTRVAYDGIVRIDIIMLGIFAVTSAIAEYSVAKRLAELAQIGNRLMAPVFTPRMRYALAKDDKDGLSYEYRQNRFIASIAALLLLTVYYLFGELVLGVFGDYQEAWPVLLILVGGYVMSSLYGATGRYLNMAGYANFSLYTVLGLLLCNIALNTVLIPIWGTTGAALSTAIALLITTSTIAYLIWKLDNFNTLSLALAVTVASMLFATLSWVIVPAYTSYTIPLCIVLSCMFFLLGERYLVKDLSLLGLKYIRRGKNL